MSGQRDPDGRHPDERHPDTKALAEYRAGLADGRRGRRLAAHVASCDRCASVSDQLAAVSSALASAPAPTLPDAVERRITAALATETALTTEAAPMAETAPAAETAAGPRPSRGDGSGPSRGDASGPSRGDSSGPPRRARGIRGGRRLRPAVLVSASAAACLAVFGAVFLLGLVRFSSGSSSSSSAASSSGSAPLSAQAAAPAASPVAGAAAGGRAAGSAEKAAFAVTASGTRYEPATLAAQVRAELTAKSAGSTSPSPASAHVANPSTPGTASYSTLAACVLSLTGQVRPSLVDWATYQGKPVYVIAVPDRAWVVGPDCTASDSHLITSIGL